MRRFNGDIDISVDYSLLQEIPEERLNAFLTHQDHITHSFQVKSTQQFTTISPRLCSAILGDLRNVFRPHDVSRLTTAHHLPLRKDQCTRNSTQIRSILDKSIL